ncbi:MAG: glycosyltransferase family 1 protein [Thermomicrobiales bacterium]
MRIAIDATPAAVQLGGVGRYARELLRALVGETLEHQFVLAAAATNPEISALEEHLPPGAWREPRRLPASERVMTLLWQRARLPISIERWIGPHDIFHGTDFVLPPTRARTVVTIHDLSFLLYPELGQPSLVSYLTSAVARSVKNADMIITVSASVAGEVATAYPDVEEKLVAIPNGVSRPRESERRPSTGEPVILVVGTIEPRKNHQTILDAMTWVRARCPEARLQIVGRRGWLDDEIVQAVDSARREGWATWLDDASDQDLADAYASATIFVSASRYEGFGLPVLEAMARKIPCVVSDIAAHREVAGDAVRYAPPGDPEAFSQEIIKLLTDTDRREGLAASGLARSSRFSWQETARRTLRAYALTADRDRR